MDVIAVQHGVQGHHRFVPLEEPLGFCSERCVRNHLDDVPSISPRIP